MMPFVVGERIGRVQIVHGRPDLNRVRVDEAIFDRIILANEADASSKGTWVCHAISRLDPVLQAECAEALEELVLRVHPLLSAATAGKRHGMVIRVESRKCGRSRSGISRGGSRRSAGTRRRFVTDGVRAVPAGGGGECRQFGALPTARRIRPERPHAAARRCAAETRDCARRTLDQGRRNQ